VAGRPGLELSAPGESGPRLDEIDRIERTRAVLALVAAGPVEPAMRTSADDVAIRQEPAIFRREDLLEDPLLDEPTLFQAMEEVLGESVVLRG
jgi:hypothetical protein